MSESITPRSRVHWSQNHSSSGSSSSSTTLGKPPLAGHADEHPRPHERKNEDEEINRFDDSSDEEPIVPLDGITINTVGLSQEPTTRSRSGTRFTVGSDSPPEEAPPPKALPLFILTEPKPILKLAHSAPVSPTLSASVNHLGALPVIEPLEKVLGQDSHYPERQKRSDWNLHPPQPPHEGHSPFDPSELSRRLEESTTSKSKGWRNFFGLLEQPSYPASTSSMVGTPMGARSPMFYSGAGTTPPKLDAQQPHYREGILALKMKLDRSIYNEQPFPRDPTPPSGRPYSIAVTPPMPVQTSDLKTSHSTSALNRLLKSSHHTFAAPSSRRSSLEQKELFDTSTLGKAHAHTPMSKVGKALRERFPTKARFQGKYHGDENIQSQIADVKQRKKYIIKLCRAFLMYGAPTHRIELVMLKTARALEMDCQFLYIPGCMIITFDDATLETSEMQLVRVSQGLDMSRLEEVHRLYKRILHDEDDINQAVEKLDRVLKSQPLYKPWVVILFYGVASATVGPFAFGARWIDLGPAFLLGMLVGALQLMSTRSVLYGNVFEITASIIVSFIARALGSIPPAGLFCFANNALSPIALILPGFVVLMGSLELQSKSLVAGSVRMLYAVIYSCGYRVYFR